MTYPIEPGSEVDQALDLMVMQSRGEAPDGLFASFQKIDPWNPAHMIALGTRIHMRAMGVTDTRNVVAALHGQWYGQPNR